MSYKYRPSRKAAHEFAEKMSAIANFCEQNGICQSRSGDSYYFSIGGQAYRVSNHSVEASDAGAYDWTGEQVRELYHGGRDSNTVYIHASKTRIIEIYNNLKAGKKLNGNGYEI